MQKKNVRLIKKLELFNNIRVLRARVELNDKKSYIIKVNAYRYNRDKRGENRRGRRNYVKRRKRKRNRNNREYSSAYEEKQKYY